VPFPHQQMPWYRSNLARITAALGGGMLCYAFGFGGDWHRTASLLWLHQDVPWLAFSIYFGVYALMLAVGTATTSIIGNAMGMAAFTLEFIALLFTTTAKTFNPLVVDAVVLAVVLHFHVLRLATAQREFERAADVEIDLL
jgi:hypothetical protein